MTSVWLIGGLRVLAFSLTAPLFGHQAIPLWGRALIGSVLAATTVPVAVDVVAERELVGADWVTLAVSQVSVGLMLGLGVTLLLSAAEMIGHVIHQMTGMTNFLNGEIDATVSPSAQLLGLTSLGVFIVIQGPEHLLTALMDSFVSIPLDATVTGVRGIELMSRVAAQSLSLVVRGVGPAVAALLTAQLAWAMLQRSLPQVASWFSQISVNVVFFWLALILVVTGGVWLVSDEVQNAWDWLQWELPRLAPTTERA